MEQKNLIEQFVKSGNSKIIIDKIREAYSKAGKDLKGNYSRMLTQQVSFNTAVDKYIKTLMSSQIHIEDIKSAVKDIYNMDPWSSLEDREKLQDISERPGKEIKQKNHSTTLEYYLKEYGDIFSILDEKGRGWKNAINFSFEDLGDINNLIDLKNKSQNQDQNIFKKFLSRAKYNRKTKKLLNNKTDSEKRIYMELVNKYPKKEGEISLQNVINYVEGVRSLYCTNKEWNQTINLNMKTLDSEIMSKDNIFDKCCGLREDLVKENLDFSNKIRKYDNSPKEKKGLYCEHKKIPEELEKLQQYYDTEVKDESDSVEYIKKCANVMYKFLIIHPFEDGNGRTSRALFSTLLVKKDILPPIMYESRYITEDPESSAEYNKALHEGDRGNMDKVGEFVLKQCEKTITNIAGFNQTQPKRENSKQKALEIER